MPVFARSFHRLFSSLRRGPGIAVVGMIGLGVVATGSWFALTPVTEKTDSAHTTVSSTFVIQPGAVADNEAATPPDYGRILSGLLRRTNSPERTRAMLEPLQSWLRADPDAAAAWLGSQSDVDHTEILTELFAMPEVTPRDAVALADHLVQADPAAARDCGYGLIFGLNRRGEFALSSGYATAAPEGVRRDLVIAAYHDWGRQQPEQALLSATHVADPAARQFALQSVLSGWARSHPEELAQTALSFPEGEEKSAALTKALRAWMIKDPWQAGDWILAHPATVPIVENFFARDER